MWWARHLKSSSELWRYWSLSCCFVFVFYLFHLVQISAVLSARSPSRGVGLRITCWAASHLHPYLTIVRFVSSHRTGPCGCVSFLFFKPGNAHSCFVCLCVQLMFLVKTAESVPSVWRIWYREKLSPGWLASVSTIRGNKIQLLYFFFCSRKIKTGN